MADLSWRLAWLSELKPEEVYELLALRSRVFVLEQRCAYLDPDGLDLDAWHLLGRNAQGVLQAYARLLPPGCKGPAQTLPAIGRVLTAPELRGQGQGQVLMQMALAHCGPLWPGQAIALSAQAHLQAFYEGLGFQAISPIYDEDGIPHVDMQKQA